MYIVTAVLALIACFLLILVVLVQNSKGGGLASNFSSSNQVMGVRKTTDFLEKATWTLAIALLLLSMVSSMSIPQKETEQDTRSLIYEQMRDLDPNMAQPSEFPSAPAAGATPTDAGAAQ